MKILPEKLLKYQEHKIQTQDINLKKRYKDTNPKKAQRCSECGDYLEFSHYQNRQTQEEKIKLKFGNFCKVRWCPMCAWRKVKKISNEFKSVLQQIEEAQQVRYLFLTLALKNPPLEDLKITVKRMSEAFNRMKEFKEWKKSIIGYLRAIEFMGDKTDSGQAHPHFHCILVVDESYFTNRKYLSQAKWINMWQKALRIDYKPTANIKTIKSKNENWKDSDSAIYETIKYIVKPAKIKKLTQEQFEIFDKQSRGLRQYNKGGLIKQFKPIKGQELDPEIWEEMEKMIAKWTGFEYLKKSKKPLR